MEYPWKDFHALMKTASFMHVQPFQPKQNREGMGIAAARFRKEPPAPEANLAMAPPIADDICDWEEAYVALSEFFQEHGGYGKACSDGTCKQNSHCVICRAEQDREDCETFAVNKEEWRALLLRFRTSARGDGARWTATCDGDPKEIMRQFGKAMELSLIHI